MHRRGLGLVAITLAAACGGAGGDAPAPQPGLRVRIEPETTTVSTGEARRFTAIVTGASDSSVAWSVSEGALGGAITPDGVYTAPAAPGTFHVVATSNADRNASAQAAVVVNASAVVAISVSPQLAAVSPQSTIRFTAQVSGTNDARVQWSADSGSMQQDGSWTAPQASGTFHVSARSVADPTRIAVATATVSPAAVSIAIEPDKVTVSADGPGFQFKAHVTGNPDTSVTWSLQQPAGLATIDAAGVFKPPPTEGIFHVVATSHADPTKTATAVVNVAEDLIDHGGPVVPTTRTFALWWGDSKAFAADAHTALEDMLRGLDGSTYLAVADHYMRGARATTSFAGNLFDPTTPPEDPALTVIAEGACRAYDASGTTPREGDLMFVNTANFPQQAQGRYCAWHSWTTCHGHAILLAYMPNAKGSWCDSGTDLCKSGLSIPTLSLLFFASHEFMESITDPFATAWYGSTSWEVSDRCGLAACAPLSTRTFEVSPLYSNAKHACVVE